MSNKKRYKIISFIVGPYLPKSKVEIGNFVIEKINEMIESNIPSPPRVEGENIFTFQGMIRIEKPTHKVIFEVEALSSKDAQAIAEKELKYFSTILTVGTPGYKYIYQISKLIHLPRDTEDRDPESALSPPLKIIHYNARDNKELLILKNFYKKIINLFSENNHVERLIEIFSEALFSEIKSDPAEFKPFIKYYHVLELISSYVVKKIKTPTNSNKKLTKIVKDLENRLREEDLMRSQLEAIRKANREVQKINDELIAFRILKAAQCFNFNREIIKKINIISKIRSKLMAHPGKEKIIQEDIRDIREIARIFIREYFEEYFQIEIPEPWLQEKVEECDKWYRVSYSRSDTKA